LIDFAFFKVKDYHFYPKGFQGKRAQTKK